MSFKLLMLVVSLPALAFGAVESDDLPFSPAPGKCYARVVVPASYKVVREEMMVKPETYSVQTIPAKYGFENREVVVREASEKTRIIPAKYKTIKEQVMVEDEKRHLTAIPAKYRWVNKRIMVKPAGYEWKKGKGPYQKVNHATGEILCYTKTPAVYKNVKEKVLVAEASTREKVIPAKYGFVTKTVLVEPERVVKTAIPAVTKTVRMKKMISEPSERRIAHPAKYKMISKKILNKESFTDWRPILCETNATRPTIAELQRKLSRQGFYKGPIDGIYGKDTYSAVSKFQSKYSLASGGLTEETLEKLKITL